MCIVPDKKLRHRLPVKTPVFIAISLFLQKDFSLSGFFKIFVQCFGKEYLTVCWWGFLPQFRWDL